MKVRLYPRSMFSIEEMKKVKEYNCTKVKIVNKTILITVPEDENLSYTEHINTKYYDIEIVD